MQPSCNNVCIRPKDVTIFTRYCMTCIFKACLYFVDSSDVVIVDHAVCTLSLLCHTQVVVDAVLCVQRGPDVPIDLHMVEIQQMMHRTDTDTKYTNTHTHHARAHTHTHTHTHTLNFMLLYTCTYLLRTTCNSRRVCITVHLPPSII